MDRKKEYISVIAAFLTVLFGLTVTGIFQKDQAVSRAERRPLAQLPAITAQRLFDGQAMTDLEHYAVDQFPFRDSFRSLKAFVQYKIYGQRDNNGIYITEDGAGKLEYPLREERAVRFAERLSRVYEMYLTDKDNVFYTIVPDKGYFLAGENGLPAMDYDRQLALVWENMPAGMHYIDIFDTLSIEKYYRTDTHWKCEALRDTAEKIAVQMGFEERMRYENVQKILTDDFYGVYYGQSAMPLAPDRLCYIENEAIRESVVTDYDKNKTGGVYNEAYEEELDPYAYFLNGASSLLVIENPLAERERELILFRDSFGSSIAPWFVEAYGKITVIDIRYVLPEALEEWVSFDNADVLFLYSTLIINNSETIK